MLSGCADAPSRILPPQFLAYAGGVSDELEVVHAHFDYTVVLIPYTSS